MEVAGNFGSILGRYLANLLTAGDLSAAVTCLGEILKVLVEVWKCSSSLGAGHGIGAHCVSLIT